MDLGHKSTCNLKSWAYVDKNSLCCSYCVGNRFGRAIQKVGGIFQYRGKKGFSSQKCDNLISLGDIL